MMRALFWQLVFWPLALAFALPPGVLPWLAGIAFVPLLIGILNHRAKPWYYWGLMGWGGGCLHYGVQVGWLPHVLRLGGFPPWHQGLVLALVVLGLGLSWGLVLGVSNGLHQGWRFRLNPFGNKKPLQHSFQCRLQCHVLLAFPVLITLQALFLNHFPWNGVPWGALASSQWQSVLGGWLAPLLGAAGISLILGFINSAWAAWWLAVSQKMSPFVHALVPKARAWYIGLGLGLSLLSLGSAWPRAVLQTLPVNNGDAQSQIETSFKAILVNVNLKLSAGQAQTAPRLKKLMAHTASGMLTSDNLRHKASTPAKTLLTKVPILAVWPESAAGGQAEKGRLLVDVATFGRVLGMDILLGSDATYFGQRYNSALLVLHTPFDVLRYDKTLLVPFGEYTPRGWGWLLGRTVSTGSQGYHAGNKPPLLAWGGGMLGVAVCLEGLTAWQMRKTVRAGAQALVVISNHAWLPLWAKHQHFALASMVALQVGRDALLVSNAGITGMIQAGLPVRQVLPVMAPQQETLPPRAILASATWRNPKTPWVLWGSWPLLGVCVLILCLAKTFRVTDNNSAKKCIHPVGIEGGDREC